MSVKDLQTQTYYLEEKGIKIFCAVYLNLIIISNLFIINLIEKNFIWDIRKMRILFILAQSEELI